MTYTHPLEIACVGLALALYGACDWIADTVTVML